MWIKRIVLFVECLLRFSLPLYDTALIYKSQVKRKVKRKPIKLKQFIVVDIFNIAVKEATFRRGITEALEDIMANMMILVNTARIKADL